MGCGWLGFPLAKVLIKEGYEVHGTTTTKDKLPALEKKGVNAYLISISEDTINGPIEDFLKKLDVLVINVPPKLRGARSENYIEKMELVSRAISESKIRKIVFVSSTSVYGNIQGKVSEETEPQPTTESGIQLLASEEIFRAMPNLETTIIRFGGLIGEDRHPINMLSGRSGLKNGNHPVNLIHLDDCISILGLVIKNNWWGEIFNAVYPLHPTKKEYYQQVATKKGMILPKYGGNSQFLGKEINSSRLIFVKKYIFKTSILG